MNKRIFLFVFLLIAGMPAGVHAETLNDPSIRKLYADSVTAMTSGDRVKISQILQTRLGLNFTLTMHEAHIIGNTPAQTSSHTYNKNQTIQDTIQGFSTTKLAKYQDNITGIQYSHDKKTALVTASGGSSGTMNLPAAGQHGATAHYVVQQACLDTLALVGAVIQFIKSDCNNRIMIYRCPV